MFEKLFANWKNERIVSIRETPSSSAFYCLNHPVNCIYASRQVVGHYQVPNKNYRVWLEPCLQGTRAVLQQPRLAGRGTLLAPVAGRLYSEKDDVIPVKKANFVPLSFIFLAHTLRSLSCILRSSLSLMNLVILGEMRGVFITSNYLNSTPY